MLKLRWVSCGNAVLVLCVLLLTLDAASSQIIQHRGAVDPTTEGFSIGFTGGASLEPVLDDFGVDAWSIHTASGNQFGFYRAFLSPEQQRSIGNQGWMLSAELRIAQVPEAGIPLARFYTGTKLFHMSFGAEADGDPFVRLEQGIIGASELKYTLNETGGGYHRFSLIYDPDSDTASLWVDGVERITAYAGNPLFATPRIDWGGGQGVTHTHWSDVTLDVIPEPTVTSLLVSAVILSAGATRYSRARKTNRRFSGRLEKYRRE
jgi:hypothetical protein